MANRSYNFKKIINRLMVFVALGILAHVIFLSTTIDRDTFEQIRDLKFRHIALAILLAFGPWVGHVFRVMLWTNFVKQPLSFKDSLSIVIANDLGSSLTPTSVGGGPVKLIMLISKGIDSAKATFIILLSACEDLVFYTVGILLSVYYMSGSGKVFKDVIVDKTQYIGIGAGVILLFYILHKKKILRLNFLTRLLPNKVAAFMKRTRESLKKSGSEIKSTFRAVWKKGKLRFLLSVFLLFFQWFTKFGVLAVVLTAMNIPISGFQVIIKQWIIYMGMLLVPTPGGSGGAEAAFLFMFSKDISGATSNLVVSLWRFFTYYFIMVCSVVIYQFLNIKDIVSQTNGDEVKEVDTQSSKSVKA